MKVEKDLNNEFDSSTRKKLESIIKHTKNENDALKKILEGLERIKQDTEKKINSKKRK